MKKILLAMACVLPMFAVSCEKLVEEPLSIQFEEKNYVMTADEALTVKVIASKAPAADLQIPVEVAGNAVLDEDYTMSGQTVLIKQGTTSAELVLTPKHNVKDDLKINLALQAGEGYILGNVPVAEVAVAPKEVVVWSFSQASALITDEFDIELNLIGKKSGADFVAPKDLHFPFVLSDQSTAKLGKNFTIKGDATEFVVKKGEKSAKITVVEAEPDATQALELSAIFSLDLGNAAEYEAGVNSEFVLNFIRPLQFSDLLGKWQYSSYPLIEDTTVDRFMLDMMMGETGDKVEDLPSNNTKNDVLEFKVDGGANKLVPALQGDLKKFFRECEVTSIAPIKYKYYYYEKDPEWNTYELTLSSANKLFSGSKEDIKEAKVIISLRNGGQTLDVVIRDYTPTDFLRKMYEYDNGSVYGFQPELWDQYFIFTKVE